MFLIVSSLCTSGIVHCFEGFNRAWHRRVYQPVGTSVSVVTVFKHRELCGSESVCKGPGSRGTTNRIFGLNADNSSLAKALRNIMFADNTGQF